MLKLGGAVKPDYEEKKELRVSLLSIDTATPYAWCHAEFVIAVTDVPEAPTFLHLSNYAGSVPENQPGVYAADIVTEDDSGDTHTYSLVSGEAGASCDGRRPEAGASGADAFPSRGLGTRKMPIL